MAHLLDFLNGGFLGRIFRRIFPITKTLLDLLLEGILLDGTFNLVQFLAVIIEHIVQRIEF